MGGETNTGLGIAQRRGKRGDLMGLNMVTLRDEIQRKQKRGENRNLVRKKEVEGVR